MSKLKSFAKTIGIILLAMVFSFFFLLNDPGSWRNYERCLQVQGGMSGAEVIEILGEPDSSYIPDHGRFDLLYVYDRYAWNSSGPILIKLDLKEDTVVVGKVCEDIW